MLNSTKTWQEEKIKHTAEHIGIISEGALKTLVSEIRQQDMEKLLRRMPKMMGIDAILAVECVKDVIKDYYKQ